MDCGNRVRVVLLAPSKVVAGATNGPCTESNRRDVQVRISQSACTHCPSKSCLCRFNSPKNGVLHFASMDYIRCSADVILLADVGVDELGLRTERVP